MDLISVIIPYYKKKKYIVSTINSVLRQSYKNLELIIIYDDVNLDDLVLLKLLKKKDKRIKIYINKKNLGAGMSRNKGIKLSNGKLIAFLDSDDLWLQDKLKKQIFFMKENKIKISHTSYHIIDYANKIIGNRQAKDLNYEQLLNSCDIGLSTVILDKKLIKKNIKFPDIKTKEDFVLWLKICQSENNIFALKDNLTKWRRLNKSLSSSKFQRIKDGYLVYRRYMKFSRIKSIIYLSLLSINYLLKRLKNI
jgi:teichuronic acid biosynthesis glycosyltransferase TuaG|tara:strand:+ start:15239 stop:15991 length:753 start_codon:yes stop_codon:yes gene_type:complete